MADIHPTAIVDPAAKIGQGVTVGAYSCIGPNVTLGDNVRVMNHAVVDGYTDVGAEVQIFPFAAVGTPPQDMKYQGEKTHLEVGPRTRIREHVTLHPGTEGGGGITRVGADCLLMVGCHIAHDCLLGDHVIIVNNVLLGGHVTIGDFAVVGGQSAVHQFVRIGQHAMIGGATGVVSDIIPYATATGNRAHLSGLNLIGLRRRNFPRDDIHGLRAAYKQLFESDGLIEERLSRLKEDFKGNPLVTEVTDFIAQDTSRALCRPGSDRGD